MMPTRTKRLALCCCAAALLASVGPGLGQQVESDVQFVLRGSVVEEDGSPVEGGTICFDQRTLLGPITEGTFELHLEGDQLVRAGIHSVIYTGENDGIAAVRTIRTAAGQKEAYLRIKLGGTPVIKGRVVWQGLGVPAPEVYVEVQAALAEDRELGWHVRPAPDGSFCLYGPPLVRGRIGAKELVAPRGVYRRPLTTAWVQIRPPYPMDVTLRLPAGPGLVGRVVETEGRPVAGAIVIYNMRRGRHWGSVATGQDGTFVLDTLEPDDYCIDVYAKEFAHWATTVTITERPEVEFLSIELAPAPMRPVRGRVIGPDGRTGVSGAEVEFLADARPSPCGRVNYGGSWTGRSTIIYEAVADEQGQFVVDLPTDLNWESGAVVHWSVEVRADGYLERRYVAFSPSSGREYLEFQLFRGGVISGRVAIEGEIPRDSRAVLLVPAGVVAGASASGGDWKTAEVPTTGEFELRGPPGEYWLYVELPGFPDPAVQVQLEEGETISITLVPPPGVVLEGTVVNAETGEPVAGAGISANRRDERVDLQDHAGGRTDEQGRYRLSPLSLGEIRLYASALGTTAEQTIRVEAPGLHVVDFRLIPRQPYPREEAATRSGS
ncbi:MAG: carboxypeptidase regulatory-like domain-containing protein [Armatimonadetes bacterium]|nr:carboxypeptidase regulatory-like domain-containing protein [Armatimonadota bacterium]